MVQKLCAAACLVFSLQAGATPVVVERATVADYEAILPTTLAVFQEVINPCLQQVNIQHGLCVSLVPIEGLPISLMGMLTNPVMRVYKACDSNTREILGYAATVKRSEWVPSPNESAFSTGKFLAGADESDVVIRQLHVCGKARGQGIGKRLMAAIIADYPESTMFSLCTVKTNESAIKFYMKLGFIDVTVGDEWRTDGRIRMRVTREAFFAAIENSKS